MSNATAAFIFLAASLIVIAAAALMVCAFRRSQPGTPGESGRLYRFKPARDSDDPGRLAGQALVSTSSSGQLAGSWSSF